MTLAAIGVKQYKYPNYLLALYLTFLLLTVVLANRFTMIGIFIQAGGIFVFPLTFLIGDIVSEVYGYSMSRQFIWIGAICEVIFAIIATIVVHLSSPPYINAEAYTTVFDPTIRYVFSGIVALLVGEFANIYFLVKWKIKLQGRLFWLRSICATAIGQAALTIIVDILAFTGHMPLMDLIWMMISGFSWKMAYAILLVYPAWLIVKLLKKKDGVDYYDTHTNFNPFKLN